MAAGGGERARATSIRTARGGADRERRDARRSPPDERGAPVNVHLDPSTLTAARPCGCSRSQWLRTASRSCGQVPARPPEGVGGLAPGKWRQTQGRVETSPHVRRGALFSCGACTDRPRGSRPAQKTAREHLLGQVGERLLLGGRVGRPVRGVPDLDSGVGADDDAVAGRARRTRAARAGWSRGPACPASRRRRRRRARAGSRGPPSRCTGASRMRSVIRANSAVGQT